MMLLTQLMKKLQPSSHNPAQVHRMIKRKMRKLRTIPNINNGGCAIVAYSMYEYLKDKGIKTKIVYIKAGSSRTATNKKVPGCYHALIQVGDYVYDAETVIDTKKIRSKHLKTWICSTFKPFGNKKDVTTFSPTTLLDLINNTYSWNPQFKRHKHIHKIAKIVGEKYTNNITY